MTWCTVGVSARIWNAVKSLGVPNPVGSSQSTPTSLLAVNGSAIARALKSGSSQARATRRAAGVGPICSANSVKRRCSSAVKMPFSMHSSRRAISSTSKSVISSTIGFTVRSWSWSWSWVIVFRSTGGLEPALGDLGTQRVRRGPGVSVPQIGHGEADDVEPFGFRIGAIPGLVFRRGTFVGHHGDLACRTAHVFGGAGVEEHRQFTHRHGVADTELRFGGFTGVDLRVPFAHRVDDVAVPLDLRPVAREPGLGRQGLSGEAVCVTLLDLGHSFSEFRQADVVLLDQYASD